MDRNEIKYPDWQPLYRQAILETDPKKLQERVIAAEEAIVARSQALRGNPEAQDERDAIAKRTCWGGLV
jgi:hypothetical protein